MPTHYPTLRHLLQDYPEFQGLLDARSAATMARDYDPVVHKATQDACQAFLVEHDLTYGRLRVGAGPTETADVGFGATPVHGPGGTVEGAPVPIRNAIRDQARRQRQAEARP